MAGSLAVLFVTGSLWAGASTFNLTGANTKVTFLGTKPNGKHDGGFKNLTGTATLAGKDATSLKIAVEIDVDSLYSDHPKLTNHLKSPDFFGVKSNPKAKFVTTKIEKASGGYTVTGDLTMLGKTAPVTFPAQISVTGDSLTLASTFKIDRTQWGMTYGQGKVHNDVTLTLSVNAKK
jgi:polyisoprenoid-binding protein YceI